MIDYGNVIRPRVSAYKANEPFVVSRRWRTADFSWDSDTASYLTWVSADALEHVQHSRLSEDLIAWTDWQLFRMGELEFRAFQLKFRSTSADNFSNLMAGPLDFSFDVPDIFDSGNDVPIFGDLTSISFTRTFTVPPAVNVVLQDRTFELFPIITNKTTTGFDVWLADSTGATVSLSQAEAVLLDWVAKGY